MKMHGISSLSRHRKVLALAAIVRDLLGMKGWERAMMPRQSEDPLETLLAFTLKYRIASWLAQWASHPKQEVIADGLCRGTWGEA